MKGILFSWGVTELRFPPPSFFHISRSHAKNLRMFVGLHFSLWWTFIAHQHLRKKRQHINKSSQRCTLQFRGINVTCLATTGQNGNLSQAQCLGIVWAPRFARKSIQIPWKEKKLTSSQALEMFKNSWFPCHDPFWIQKNQGTACTLDHPWHLDICQLGTVYMTVGPTWVQGVRAIINDSRLGDGKACIYSPIATGPESIRKCAYVVIYVRM